jgi:hypothetical protein
MTMLIPKKRSRAIPIASAAKSFQSDFGIPMI